MSVCSGKLMFGTALKNLGLAVMIGGMLALGMFAAPTLFQMLQPAEAGRVMGDVFTKFDKVLLVGLIMAGIGEAMRVCAGGCDCKKPVGMLHNLSMAALIVLVLYSTFGLHPELQKMQPAEVAAGNGQQSEDFAKKHQQSEGLYKFQLIVAILVLVLKPFVPPKGVSTYDAATNTEELPEHSLPHPSEFDDEVVNPDMGDQTR